MRIIKAAVLLCWVALTGTILAADKGQPMGTWIGHWTREGAMVDVTMRFSKSPTGYEGSFDSEGLRAVGIPVQKIIWNRPNLSWAVVSDSNTELYSGQLRGDALVGHFKQGDASGRFSFIRSKHARPVTRHEDITFISGGVVLAGTIYIPAGKGRHPGIVFLHGSGPEGRWASNYLAESFARRGFAALTFDKRGVGRSGGDWQQVGFEELAADAAAAVAELSAKPYVTRGKVGIHGHSQGGILAPMVAARIDHLAFVIASAGSGLSMRETETFSVENSLGIKNLSPGEAQEAHAFVKAVMDTAFGGQPYEHAVEAWRLVQTRPWAFGLPPRTHSYWSFSRKIANYDALAYWRRVAAPTLLVFGEADERVPPRPSAVRIAEAYLSGQGPSFQVLFFPGANHTFRLPAIDGQGFSWPRTAPGYPDALIKWAGETVEPAH